MWIKFLICLNTMYCNVHKIANNIIRYVKSLRVLCLRVFKYESPTVMLKDVGILLSNC